MNQKGTHCCYYSEKLPIKDRNFSYYLTENKSFDNYNSCSTDNLISTNMRMTNIESRLNTMEKMMKYFDEFLNLKEEEKLNNLTSLEYSPLNNAELISKIYKLEEDINNIKKQNKLVELENEKKIGNLNQKIHFLEEIIKQNGIKIPQNFDEVLNSSINFNKENKLEMDEVLQKKINEIYNSNKISEMLCLIEDINKIAEDNEFNINEQNENIRKIQNDNLTLIKIIDEHSEKIKKIDYIMNEGNEVKNKYFEVLSMVNNVNSEKEREIFTNEIIEQHKLKNDDDNFDDNK